jgi:3-hydroxyisobutyrate dehydrogenase-like beta-hydroxyacid dehydrogenase
MKPASVAILSTGEMGHLMARALGEKGIRVLTCLEGRSARTRELAAKSGVQDLPTLEALVAAADVIISVVVPSAARSVASAVAAAINKTGKSALYADANAISPQTSKAIEDVISSAGGRYVDACIIGAACFRIHVPQ